MNNRLILLYLFAAFVASIAPSQSREYTKQQADSVFKKSIADWQDYSLSDSTRFEAALNLLVFDYEFGLGIPREVGVTLSDSLIAISDRSDDLRLKAYGSQMKAADASLAEDYPSALQHLRSALDIHRLQNDTLGMAIAEQTLAYYSQGSGAFDQAVEHYRRSSALYHALGLSRTPSTLRHSMTECVWKQKDTSRALAMSQENLKSLDILLASDQTNVLRLHGSILATAVDLDSGMVYLKEALEIAKRDKDRYAISMVQIEIARAYIANDQYKIAHQWCLKSQKAVEQFPFGTINRDLYECLYKTNKDKGNSAAALRYYELWNDLKYSRDAVQTTRQIDLMSFDQRLAQDSLKNEVKLANEIRGRDLVRNSLIGGGAILFLIAVGLFSRNRYMKRSNDVITRERDLSDSLLLNILPAAVAKELKERGETTARDYETVSILFTDFVRFTQASEKLDAKELVEEINHCFKAFDDICDRFEIEKIKTIGDSYMAAGGVPTPSSTAAESTVKAAIAMAGFMAKRSAERQSEGKIPFEMRVGVHSGPVVAGIVGVKKFQYDVWGNTVNTASRMESSGEAGKVNISRATYDLIKDDPEYTFEARGLVDAKGKGEMEMWFVSSSAT